MIATITFSSIAEWVVSAAIIGFIAGAGTATWLIVRLSRKK